MTITILKENVEYPEFNLENPNGLNKDFIYLNAQKWIIISIAFFNQNRVLF